ncbi:MAG: 50S ribosomal protein L10, partial [Patescibacteria group bacterium]
AKTRKVRAELRKAGIAFKVAKKTLLKRAAEAVGFGQMPEWGGEIGVAAGYGDVTEAPRILAKFAKGNGELKIAGGFYEAVFRDADIMERLAAIPSRETLLTQLAFILSQPVAGLARALNEVSKKQS